MTADAFIFWFLAIVTLSSGLAVVLMSNPVFSALSLAMTMVGISALFVTLNAYFLAGVQLIVYAGAVMVLFVMVLMLFNLKNTSSPFSSGLISGALKLGSVGVLAGLIVGTIALTQFSSSEKIDLNQTEDTTKVISKILYTNNVLAFEVLGVLLLVIAVGTVALSRSKGGTHAKH